MLLSAGASARHAALLHVGGHRGRAQRERDGCVHVAARAPKALHPHQSRARHRRPKRPARRQEPRRRGRHCALPRAASHARGAALCPRRRRRRAHDVRSSLLFLSFTQVVAYETWRSAADICKYSHTGLRSQQRANIRQSKQTPFHRYSRSWTTRTAKSESMPSRYCSMHKT